MENSINQDKKSNIMTIRATVPVEITFVWSDFEGSCQTWEDFIKEMKTDTRRALETLASNINDRDGYTEEIMAALIKCTEVEIIMDYDPKEDHDIDRS